MELLDCCLWLQVVDEFETGDGFVSGVVAAGERPYGKLCGSKNFEYVASFGPFEACGKKKVGRVGNHASAAVPMVSGLRQVDISQRSHQACTSAHKRHDGAVCAWAG
jgi:hypothetical protein